MELKVANFPPKEISLKGSETLDHECVGCVTLRYHETRKRAHQHMICTEISISRVATFHVSEMLEYFVPKKGLQHSSLDHNMSFKN